MHQEDPSERKKAEEMGSETADVMITRVKQLLSDEFYDETEHKEVLGMLRMARHLTQDTNRRKEIDQLSVDIESRYGRLQ